VNHAASTAILLIDALIARFVAGLVIWWQTAMLPPRPRPWFNDLEFLVSIVDPWVISLQSVGRSCPTPSTLSPLLHVGDVSVWVIRPQSARQLLGSHVDCATGASTLHLSVSLFLYPN
jgi:hypothetical protein